MFSSRSVVKFVVRRRVLRAIRHRVARARVTQRARSAHTVDSESTVCATRSRPRYIVKHRAQSFPLARGAFSETCENTGSQSGHWSLYFDLRGRAELSSHSLPHRSSSTAITIERSQRISTLNMRWGHALQYMTGPGARVVSFVHEAAFTRPELLCVEGVWLLE